MVTMQPGMNDDRLGVLICCCVGVYGKMIHICDIKIGTGQILGTIF